MAKAKEPKLVTFYRFQEMYCAKCGKPAKYMSHKVEYDIPITIHPPRNGIMYRWVTAADGGTPLPRRTVSDASPISREDSQFIELSCDDGHSWDALVLREDEVDQSKEQPELTAKQLEYLAKTKGKGK